MKARWGCNSNQSTAMKKEIRRQIFEQENIYLKGVDSMILWMLHVEFGFGKKRLEQAYKAFAREYDEMRILYETNDTYPAEYKLKQLGVDMNELRKQ